MAALGARMLQARASSLPHYIRCRFMLVRSILDGEGTWVKEANMEES